MPIPNYSLSYASDLVNHLNDVSIFLQSGSYDEFEDEIQLRQILDKLMFSKIEDLSSCLSYLVHTKK
ncbi:conserved hypothetical protein [Vibrio crassostreae]|jgi:hypothetical protein|nr:conserved hypothetical protein [Vibrio crassostreae]CAK3107636.1 conserved hypothetical protein [Vibrio crassostreae]CAK3523931.1 conserved hypothetical protein [Vibrio crassostreae]